VAITFRRIGGWQPGRARRSGFGSWRFSPLFACPDRRKSSRQPPWCRGFAGRV
jgi:hypothetical protein